MAKTIALNIKIQTQGGEKVVKNINELEKEIESLSNELKGLDFGSEAFEKASKDLGTLKAGLRDVEKTVEGLDKEQSIQAFGAAINGVTGAFLIASSAARIFGAEAETVEDIQRAEQAALEGVNIALGVQAIAELALQREKIKTLISRGRDILATNLQTASQAALTFVIGTSTGALKAFRIALATTGVGALVVGLGFLISKLFDASEETDDLSEKTKSLTDRQLEASQSAVKETKSIEVLARIVSDSNKSIGVREEGYKELKKLVPELTNLTLQEAIATGKLNSAVQTQIKLIKLRAKATAIEEYLVDQEKKRLVEQEEIERAQVLLDVTNEYAKLQADYRRESAGGFAGTIDEYIEQQEKLDKGIAAFAATLDGNVDAVEEVEDAYEGLNSVEKSLLETQKEILEITSQQTAAIKTGSDAIDARAKAEEAYNNKLDKLSKSLSNVASKFKDLDFSEEASVEILGRANELLEQQKVLLEERAGFFNEQIGVNDEYTESMKLLVGAFTIPTDTKEGLIEIQDEFKNLFDSLIKSGKQFDANNYEIDGVAKSLGLAADELEYLLNTVESDVFSKLNDEQKSIIVDFINQSQTVDDLLVKFNQGVREYNGALKEGEETQERAYGLNLSQFQLIEQTNQALSTRLDDFKTEAEIREELSEKVSKQIFSGKVLAELNENQLAVVQGITNSIFEQATYYKDVLDVNNDLAEVTGKISANIKQQGKDLSESEFTTLFEKIKEDAETNGKALTTFFKGLNAEASNLTKEQLDEINKYLENFKEGLDRTWESMDWKDKVGQIVAVISDLTSRIQSIAQASISLELERLAQYEKQTLAIIGDESEAAREKQLEFQKKINKERFDLEKKARVQELNFAMASSIAAGAQAVINALALPIPPPGPQIVAGLYAGLTAVELATINSQKQFVKGQQYVARRGGLVTGPSHEYGGVAAQGGMVLEGGEFIVNQAASTQYADILSSINTSTGGRGMGVDDSALVQEIRKQNQTPIKTYVMYEDIQNTNKINSRLEEISRL